MNYFTIEEDKTSGYTGYVDGTYKWGLPGVICPHCKSPWSGGFAYPSVDLTPVAALADFETPRPEPIEEYERLCELIRPLLPPGAVLDPGTEFGPFVGKGQGRFGAFVAPVRWVLMVQRDALEKLQAEGLRGLAGYPPLLRFRQRNSPEFLELEVLPVARLHPDCMPPEHQPPCPRCGRRRTPLPKSPLLDATTVPESLDLFRLRDYSTLLVCTERFVDACQRLGLDGIAFQALPTRASRNPPRR
ncbi:double-CXXCG motif protein [Archangium sp.]|uniref:SitI6 family double-CXXCG motif immunity protein n=1 Tax=Archangium sp. TaxID=1872627 RepID=UPI0038998BF6